MAAVANLKESTPLQARAGAQTNRDDRLESNKSDESGVCSMGGAGRSQKQKHRTRNIQGTDSGTFKLDRHKDMSQSFAANIASKLPNNKKMSIMETAEHLLDL